MEQNITKLSENYMDNDVYVERNAGARKITKKPSLQKKSPTGHY